MPVINMRDSTVGVVLEQDFFPRTVTYHPRANPTERKNQEVKVQLRIYLQGDQMEWKGHLPNSLYCTRRRRNEAMVKTPAELVMGRNLTLPREWRVTGGIAEPKHDMHNASTRRSQDGPGQTQGGLGHCEGGTIYPDDTPPWGMPFRGFSHSPTPNDAKGNALLGLHSRDGLGSPEIAVPGRADRGRGAGHRDNPGGGRT
ncbi:hypothetical protein PR048_029469 [Dryococelus australis]|uniref:Uncharacterized protein n=1 Tax=Dryococelus australis TaxID=614101 RepID=A0ABQ9GFU9_9NEOP|nr:hypothetical protein PR048_029469 [Dryococelus australis]